MKILFTILTLTTCFKINSQTNIYHPLPDSNTVWSVGKVKYLVKGDTLYHSQTYQKYYFTSDTSLTPSSLHFVAMVRQDIVNKRIYGIEGWQQTERLIYDFSLHINDTLTVYPLDITCSDNPIKIKVTSIDSILINGSYRKRSYIAGYSTIMRDTIIEGIGSSYGPLAMGLDPYCATDVCWPVLLCEKQNGVLMYQNSNYSTCYGACSGGGISQYSNLCLPQPCFHYVKC